MDLRQWNLDFVLDCATAECPNCAYKEASSGTGPGRTMPRPGGNCCLNQSKDGVVITRIWLHRFCIGLNRFCSCFRHKHRGSVRLVSLSRTIPVCSQLWAIRLYNNPALVDHEATVWITVGKIPIFHYRTLRPY
jgi:hypothetical protein